MLAVGAFGPGASASPYQTLLRRSLLATRLTFAVRSRVYLHHKCFETQLVLDLYRTSLDEMCGWGGEVVVDVMGSQLGHIHCRRACRVGPCGVLSHIIARSLRSYTAHSGPDYTQLGLDTPYRLQ